MPPAFRYFGPAIEQVSRYIPDKAYNSHVEHGILSAKALTLSALFAHLRVRPHDAPVANFEAELAESLEQSGITNVLEIGPQYFPFWPILKDIAPLINVFGLGLEAAEKVETDGINYKSGNVMHGIRSFFDGSFDLIIAIGVFTRLGFTFPSSQSRVNQTVVDLTHSLSNNPLAALFAASYKPLKNPTETLLFRRSGLAAETNILVWHQPEIDAGPDPHYLDKFRARPASRPRLAPSPSLVVLAKREVK